MNLVNSRMFRAHCTILVLVSTVWLHLGYAPAPPRESLTQYKAEGKWAGVIYQNSESGIARKYTFELEVFIDQDNISGFSTISMINEPGVYGILNITGKVTKNGLDIKETRIIEEQIYSYAYWCIKSYQLTFEQKNDKLTLTGNWSSDKCSGQSSIYLEKIPDKE